MSQIRKIGKQLHNGIKVKENIQNLDEVFSLKFSEYIWMELSMQGFFWQETKREDYVYRGMHAYKDSVEEEKMYALLDDMAAGKVFEYQDQSFCEDLRQENRKRVEAYLGLVEEIEVCEGVLEDVCYKYTKRTDLKDLLDYPEERFLQEYLQFLFGNPDQSVMQQKIQSMMGRIPCHISNQKMMDKMEGAIRLFEGSDENSLDEFLYMVRGITMIMEYDKSRIEYPELLEQVARLKENVGTISKAEEFQAYTDEIHEIKDFLQERIEYLDLLQLILNELEVAVILGKREETSSVLEYAKALTSEILHGPCKEHAFDSFVGPREEFLEERSYLEATIHMVATEYEEEVHELDLEEEYEDHYVCCRLCSDSKYMDAWSKNDLTFLTREDIEKQADLVLCEMEGQFTKVSKRVRNVIKRNTMHFLPLEFTNSGEVKEYIRTNLFGCLDESEKAASLLRLRKQMSEESM